MPDDNEGQLGADGQEGTGSDDTQPQDDNSKLLKALAAEREAKRTLERRLKEVEETTRRAKQTKEEQLQEALGKLEAFEVKSIINDALAVAVKAAAKEGYEVDLDDAREMVSLASVTRDNAETVVERIAAKLRKPKSASVTPTKERRSDTEQTHIDPATVDATDVIAMAALYRQDPAAAAKVTEEARRKSAEKWRSSVTRVGYGGAQPASAPRVASTLKK